MQLLRSPVVNTYGRAVYSLVSRMSPTPFCGQCVVQTTTTCVGGACINARFPLKFPQPKQGRQIAVIMPVLIQLFGLCFALFGLAGCVRLEDFYPFGAAAGDQELARADDGFSAPLRLKERFPYYDREESIIYVSSSYFLLSPRLFYCPLPQQELCMRLVKVCACTVSIIGCVRMQLARLQITAHRSHFACAHSRLEGCHVASCCRQSYNKTGPNWHI